MTATGGADVTERGVYYGTGSDPAQSGTKVAAATAGAGAFTVNLTGLTAGTAYNVVAYAVNSAGTEFGAVQSFTTRSVTQATVTSTEPSFVTTNAKSIRAGGNVTNAGGGTVSERGVCWGVSPNPVATGSHLAVGAGLGNYTVTIHDLGEGTLYYVRAYAINEAGTAYGTEYQILTMASDVDGNIYKTVRIGSQVWMAENLKTTRYRDGSPIPNVTDNTAWAALTADAYCWYNNNESNKATYGALYNWYAVNTGKLCPAGWHVPTTGEWTDLSRYVGSYAGTKLKSTSGWYADGNGTDEYGFSGLPGGYRYYGNFDAVGQYGEWWSSTEFDGTHALIRSIVYHSGSLGSGPSDKPYGCSVRCVRD